MFTHSLLSRTPRNRFRHTPRRQAGFVRFSVSAAKRIAGRRSVRTEASAPSAIELGLNIEEAIRYFVEAQPGQLYRGGA
ncbi:hypothetical protein [Thiobaca trueperi]|uniref:Uncharacterized protein n=1 Tax=Thiobaca trueperi TaxID=127458 RepID=A0A4R3MTY5_9GAMM|nr:hypothetical protein [Thiobaca trueperi]TCT19177.1 hypothetical protein EDC35_10955 [Thiobaca trueperi]